MDIFEDNKNNLGEHSKQLGNTAIALAKVQLLQKTIAVSPIICVIIILFTFGSLILFFLFTGVAIWVTEKVIDVLPGLFFVAVIFLCIGAVISIFGESSIIPFLRNKMVNSLEKENKKSGAG